MPENSSVHILSSSLHRLTDLSLHILLQALPAENNATIALVQVGQLGLAETVATGLEEGVLRSSQLADHTEESIDFCHPLVFGVASSVDLLPLAQALLLPNRFLHLLVGSAIAAQSATPLSMVLALSRVVSELVDERIVLESELEVDSVTRREPFQNAVDQLSGKVG